MRYESKNYGWSVRGLASVGVLWMFGLVFVLGGCDFGSPSEGQCQWNGQSYAVGQSVPSSDSCNTCSCTPDGIICTAMGCPVQCEYDGASYAPGDVFDAGDGCNTCSCTENGVTVCTEMACPEQCPAPAIAETDEACLGVTVYAKNPSTGDCCFYANPCESPEGWALFATLEECQQDCVPISCPNGMSSEDTDGDGCDDVCVNLCPDEACGPALGIPNYLCPDGQTWAGPTDQCIANENGQCGWEVVQCPTECEPGTQKDADDGCNTCSCTNGGIWACTEMACQCNPDTEWNRNYMSTDPSECAFLDYACPGNTVDFANDCGCGCEQPDSCPEWFNCMPPTECDPEQITLECPYSEIAY